MPPSVICDRDAHVPSCVLFLAGMPKGICLALPAIETVPPARPHSLDSINPTCPLGHVRHRTQAPPSKQPPVSADVNYLDGNSLAPVAADVFLTRLF